MKYLSAVLALALSVVFAPAVASAQSGVTGAWEITLTTPQGPTAINLTLAQDGDKVTGKLDSPMGSVPITGTNTASAMALRAHLELQGNAVDLGLNGKAESDAMTGVLKIGDFGEFPFTGKRVAAKPEGAAAAAPNAPAGPPPTDANGKWNVVLTLGGAGSFPLSATLKQDGEKVSGVLGSMAGEVPVNGTMVGKTLKLEFKAETPQGALPITMTGELGATGFAGKASIAGLGETDWTATRVP
jgi:hypothetical protein